jgi:hypothetical protein
MVPLDAPTTEIERLRTHDRAALGTAIACRRGRPPIIIQRVQRRLLAAKAIIVGALLGILVDLNGTRCSTWIEPVVTAATKSLGDSVEIRIRDNLSKHAYSGDR